MKSVDTTSYDTSDEQVKCLGVRVIPTGTEEGIEEAREMIEKTKDEATRGERTTREDGLGDMHALEDATKPCLKANGDVKPKMLTQVLAAFVIGMTHSGVGTTFGFSGVVLPQMMEPESDDIYLTPRNVAFFGSLVSGGAIFGGLIGPIASRIGPRTTLMVLLPIILALWLMMALSPNVILILTARTILGAFVAALNVPSTAYVLEMAHQDQRGVLFAAMPTLRQIGFAFIYCLGITPLSWRKMAIICGTLFTAIPFLAMFFFPESPRWLVSKGKVKEAKNALIFFRGKKYNCQPELSEIVDQVEATKKQKNKNDFMQLFDKSTLKLFFSLNIMLILVSCNGAFIFTTYTVNIFQSSESNIDPYICVILVALIRLIGTAIFSAVVDRVGRRRVQISAYIFMSCTLALYGGYLYCKDIEWVISNLRWVPLASLMIYYFFLGLGQPTMFMLCGELLPNNVRSTGIAVLTSVMFVIAFLFTLLFPIVKDSIGEYSVFWYFGVCCILLSLFTYYFIPETSGVSLETITKREMERND